MHAAFRTILLSDAGTAALVGDRINWGAHPQGGPLPYIVLQTISDAEGTAVDGPFGLSQTRVQIDCYGLTHKSAVDASLAVRTALSGYRADQFRLIEYVTTRDGREGGTNEADRPFRVSMDFLIHWRTQ